MNASKPSTPDAVDPRGPGDQAVVAARVRAARERGGLSQEQVAAQIGISASYLSRIEAGQRRVRPALLEQLAAALGTTSGALRTGVEPDRAQRLELDLRLAQLALGSGDPQSAEAGFRGCARASNELGLVDVAQRARLGLGSALEALGRLEDAVVVLEGLREELPVDGGGWLEVMVSLCRCYREAGDLQRAVDVGEAALTSLTELGLRDSASGIRLVATLLSAYFERGDVLRATQLAADTVSRADRAGDPAGRAAAHWNASLLLANRGRVPDAVTHAERALALLGEGEDKRNLARLRVSYASLLIRQATPDTTTALEVLTRARAELRAGPGSTIDLAYAAVNLARTHLLRGDLAAARAEIEQAIDLLGERPRLETATALAVRGRIALAEGDPSAALSDLHQAATTLAVFGTTRRTAALWTEVAELAETLADPHLARRAYRAALAAVGLTAPADTIAAPVQP